MPLGAPRGAEGRRRMHEPALTRRPLAASVVFDKTQPCGSRWRGARFLGSGFHEAVGTRVDHGRSRVRMYRVAPRTPHRPGIPAGTRHGVVSGVRMGPRHRGGTSRGRSAPMRWHWTGLGRGCTTPRCRVLGPALHCTPHPDRDPTPAARA
jgi:hypothetical protein